MNDIVSYTEFLVKSIVKNPEMVKVQLFEGEEKEPMIEIIVHHDDIGAVIGKGGKMATSIRTLVQAFAFLHDIEDSDLTSFRNHINSASFDSIIDEIISFRKFDG